MHAPVTKVTDHTKLTWLHLIDAFTTLEAFRVIEATLKAWLTFMLTWTFWDCNMVVMSLAKLVIVVPMSIDSLV